MAHAGASPSLATPPSPTASRARRDSIASASTASHVDKAQLAITLDKIHNSASQTGVLTTFNDFAPAPGSLPVSENKGTAGELVQQGLSGLYSRFKEAVSAVGKATVQEADDADAHDAASKKSAASALPRGESGATNSTFDSTASSEPLTSGTMTSSGAMTADSSYPPQSSKASSITSASAPKTAPSSAQNLTKMSRGVAALTPSAAVAPATGTATGLMDKEAARGATAWAEDQPNRAAGRKGRGRATEGAPTPAASGNPSLDSLPIAERAAPSGRSKGDDAPGLEGSSEPPKSPGTHTSGLRTASASSRALQGGEGPRRPAVIDRIAFSGATSRSRSSSMEPGTAEPSPVSTSAHSSVYHESFARNEKPQRLQSGAMRIPGTTTTEGAPQMVNARLEMMRKQVLGKEFWMADETCKECFLCGTPFSAFRRKHHCRTCGCIFDSKCTSSISGQKFGVQGNLRVCKPCLNVINRRYDSGSDDSGDEYLPAIFRPKQSKGGNGNAAAKRKTDDELSMSERTEVADDTRTASTPMMAIPATRRIGDGNRNSAILEIDAGTPQLSRPSSSRSLKSLSSSRPQSSGHRRHHSKHNFLTRFKATAEERAPFRKPVGDEIGKKSKLNAFHDDNIIDPELAAFMSDESSGDEQMSIFATMNSNDIQPSSLDPDRASFGPYLNAGKKHRFRHGEKSVSGLSFTSRGHDESGGLPNLSSHNRPPRRRNLSTASASVHHLRSPRPKSGIFKGPSALADASSALEQIAGHSHAAGAGDQVPESRSEVGLNPASMQHVKKLFRQLLADADVPNAGAWERALIPILDRCADDVDPNIRNGDDMDIRHWVKLKKIPGGRPSDTTYVHGVVFTKNLALKSMPRTIRNPKILIITFPIEYQRSTEQKFMSLGPVIEQEKEFLRKVVERILNHEPQVLLVEKSVAGVALQYLAEEDVAVAYNVKPSVIDAVSRIANIPIISSVDMLMGARVGTTASFEVKTYVNHEIKGKKKTYLYISGCPKDRGCTIVLRGDSTQVLARMKRIVEFMVYVVYNLKLESCLMRDEFVFIPEAPALSPAPSSQQQTDESLLLASGSTSEQPSQTPADLVTGASSQGDNTSQLATGGAPGGDSAAPVDQGPVLPGQIKRMVSLHESHTHVSQQGQVPEDLPMPTFYSDMVAKYETRILSTSPFVKFTQPYLLMRAREQERRLAHLKRLRDQDIVEELGEPQELTGQQFQLIQPEMVHEIGQKAPRQIMEVLHAVHDVEYDKALHNYQTQTRQWETYIQGSLDLFDPYAHQNIVVLYSVTCNTTKIPCAEPGLIAIEFYNERPEASGNLDPDCTLGQFVEDVCLSSDSICHANGCDKNMAEHHRTYVHDNARITVMIDDAPKWPENFPEKPRERDGENEGTGICMWNFCKVCKKDFGLMPMSVSTWKYSFGKYLELSFWNKRLQVHPQTECPHDHQKDHIRFFYYLYRDIALSVHYDPIDLYEIIVPRPRITWKVDHDLRLKNDMFTKAEERWKQFIQTVNARLKSIRFDGVLPEKAEACKTEVERLTKKAEEDQLELIRTLQTAYMNSKYYEIIPLNAVIRDMFDKSSEWDTAFAKFEAEFLSDKDVRQLAVIQLRRFFTDSDPEPESKEPEAKESEPKDSEAKEPAPKELGTPGPLPSTDVNVLGDSELEKNAPASTQNDITESGENPSPPTDLDKMQQPPETPLSPTSGATPLAQDVAKMQADEILERVDPLDLATPGSPGLTRDMLIPPESPLSLVFRPAEPPKASREQPINNASDSLTSSASQPADVRPPAPAQQLSLTEKVEQLRREHRAASTDLSAPAPQSSGVGTQPGDRTASRRAGMTVSPPMARALTQPVGTLPRAQSNIGKLLKEHKGVDSQGGAKEEKKFTDRIGLGALKNRKQGSSAIPRLVTTHKRESKVSNLARHFEQLSREFEKERMRDRKQRAANMQNQRAFLPRTSTKAIVEVYDDVDAAVQEPGPSEDDHAEKQSIEHSTAPDTTQELSQPNPPDPELGLAAQGSPQHLVEDIGAQKEAEEHRPDEAAGSGDELGGSDGDASNITCDEMMHVKEFADSLDRNEAEELPKHQKKSLMTMLTNFWAERSSSGWTPLEYPVHPSDHIFIDSDVVVREDEPSSLIAFALSSEDYRVKLADIRHQWRISNQRDAGDSSSDGLEIKTSRHTDVRNPGPDEPDLEKSLIRSTGTHLKYQFTEGSARMTCKIFYAEQFDALRRKCGVADRIVESLSRCLKWDSKGGKTKSVFLKTLDDRLVMKSLSPVETTAFLKFAPHYFNIMTEALFHDLPSVIAKMLGFFQVIIKNPFTNTEIKLDLLVMENLFYDRSPTRTFDLKGSMRNRKIQATGEGGEVLLDQNMVEYIYESPLFAREHSKRLLRASVWNDTLFLARQDVMDYSLMIAVDEVKKELVVGIIDCIRTYTWDKQLESWIKNRGFAGGGKNKPTVTSPKEYKSRFREAMARYILQAPNCWHLFGNSLGPNPSAPRTTRFEGDV